MKWATEPLTDFTWCNPAGRVLSKFTATWSDTVERLEYEVAALGGSEIMICIDLTADKIRRDGQPKAGARAGGPAVMVEFDSRHGRLTYRCDQYEGKSWSAKMDQPWQHNVRAVVLTLAALRAVDRYGATTGEQYSGFKALPAGSGAPASAMTTEAALDWIRVVCLHAGVIAETSTASLAEAVKVAKRETHPDRNGGERERWNRTEEAIGVLKRAGRL